MTDRPVLCSWRGVFRFADYEHTIPSLRNAPVWADGAYAVARLTSDGVPVLMHDATVDRTTDGTGAVTGLTLEQVKALDAGDGAQVPTLAEYLQELLDMEVQQTWRRRWRRIMIRPAPASSAEAAQACMDVVANDFRGLLDRLTFITSLHINPTVAETLRWAGPPQVSIGTFSSGAVGPEHVHEMLEELERVGGDLLLTSPTNYTADPDSVDLIVEAGGVDAGVSVTDHTPTLLAARDDGRVKLVITPRTAEFPSWHEDDVPSEPPPVQIPGLVAEAQIRTEVRWLACDVRTGMLVSELPEVQLSSVSRALGSYESTDATVPIPMGGPGTLGEAALQATVPGRSMLVAVVNDVPAWCGLVVRRQGGTDGTLRLSLATPEAYLDRRYVGDHDFDSVDQATICAQLVGDAEAFNGHGGGLGLHIDAPPSGVARDITYLASDHATVYQRLTELMDRRNGPEWTIDVDWQPDMQGRQVRLIFRVRLHIGVEAADPSTMFEAASGPAFSARGSSDASYTFTEDWSDGAAANVVIAYAPGEGDDQPTSAPAIAKDQLDGGVPVLERRWQPSSSIETQSVLDDHAETELGWLKAGTDTWEVDARWDAYPRYGVDWALGDDVAWRLVGHRHPGGVTGRGRVVGWTLDLSAGRMKPRLAATSVVDEGRRPIRPGIPTPGLEGRVLERVEEFV